ncbi:putative maltose permease [Xylariaceae sp. FL0016]|nr:putative maltose permease [Xylariaceae sp. FL0016]
MVKRQAPDGDIARVPVSQPQAAKLDEAVLVRMTENIDNIAELTRGAAQATAFERDMRLGQALRLYPRAAAFSLILSLSLVMEDYDTALLGGFFAYPTFRRKFGVPVGDGTYQLTASWQSGLQTGVQVGEIAGLWVAGIVADRWGYKRTLLCAQVLMVLAVFLMFFAQDIRMLMVGEVLCGIPWGAFQTLTTTYAAEVSPMALRPYLTTFVNMCWVAGQMISAGVLRGFLHRTDEWGWRIPYAIQWVWPIPIIVGVLLAPESPWWLVRKGRIDEAKQVLQDYVSGENSDYNVDHNVAMMIHTNAHEKYVSEGTSYRDCFTGIDLRRTEITCVVWAIQIGCGIWFGGNVTYFLQQVGLDDDQSFDFGVGHNAVGLFGTLCSWWAMQYVGRRTLYIWGIAVMFLILLVVGFLGVPKPSDPIAYASAVLMFLFTFTFDVTVGPVAYCLVTEIPSTRLRIKTVALARNCYNVLSIAANFLNNPILNPTAWNLRGKGGFVWCGFAFVSLVWSYYRLPEPKGLSAGEMDVLFEQGVPARQFTKTRTDPFNSSELKMTSDEVERIGTSASEKM